MDHEQIPKLDPMIHTPIRLAVMSILIAVEEADFNYLKETIQATNGNLSTHLYKLETSGLIRIKKAFKGKKPHTTCSLTKKGKESFIQYIEQMEQLVGRRKKLE